MALATAVTFLLTAVIASALGRKRVQAKHVKLIDSRYFIGTAEVREEVWQDATGEVVRYNLALIDHQREVPEG
jgi:hypothetical protein